MSLAHEKWFVDDPAAFDADWDFFFQSESLVYFAAAVVVAVTAAIIARRLPTPELRFLRPLERLVPYIPRLLGIHLGVALLSLAVTRSYLAPHLKLANESAGVAIAIIEGIVGVWLISGIHLRWAAVGVVLLGPVAWALEGVVAMLESADLLGIALFLIFAPPGKDGWGDRHLTRAQLRLPLLLLRIGVGGALIVVSFSEKFANPDLAIQFLDNYPAFQVYELLGLGMAVDTFVRFAAAIELLFGLLIILGAAPQVSVILVGIPFNTTLFFLGADELFGHLPIYGAMLALLVYGSSREHAPAIPLLGHRSASR